MRRSVRGVSRLWQMGILILIYSCISAYSDKGGDLVKNVKEQLPPVDTVDPIGNSLNVPNVMKSDESTTTTSSTTTESSQSESSWISSTNTEATIDSETTTRSGLNKHLKPTWRPKRDNCTPPAIEQFPRPLMGLNTRKHGGLTLHVFVAIFTFLGLAIVCDDYFVSSLDRICEELKLSPDVAGATFMAAGSSAPELATVIIGVFFAKDDIGVSGVIGSAVFNIMFVISVCCLCSGTVCQLNWWPLVRDCFFYAVSILVMLFVIINDTISWVEALIMMLCYVVYCIVLHFNTPLERWAHTLKLPIKLPSKEEQSALVTYKNIPETSYTQEQQAVTSLTQDPNAPVQPKPGMSDSYNAYNDPNSSWDPNAAWTDNNSGAVVAAAQPAPVTSSWGENNGYNSQTNTGWGDTNASNNTWDNADGQKNYGYNQSEDPNEQSVDGKKNLQQVTATSPQQLQQQQAPQNSGYYKSKEAKPASELPNPLDKPVDGGILATIAWGIVYPIHYMCRLTMPDCRTDKYRNWYPFTFFVSMIWISFYSYFMVWMITIIGATLGIPDTVMGLTFVAAGVSVPDALSSIAVIKEGYGDMAVSNAVGSNVFDILICLGLPWFIQTAIIVPGSHVNVISKGLAYSTLSLLSTVVFLLVAVHLNGWKLDKRLGIVLMFWYVLFITVASLYELNVFGQLNPPECNSLY